MTTSGQREFNSVTPNVAEHIEALPLLITALPYQFGDSVIDHLNVSCACCGKTLEPDIIRGKFEIKAKGATASLLAYGLCFDCRTITPIEAKFHNDGTALFKGPNGWSQRRWDVSRRNNVVMLSIRLIKRKWQQLLPPVLVLGATAIWFLVS